MTREGMASRTPNEERGGQMERRRIGTYTLTEDRVFTQHYETASWWTKIAVDAGEYPIELGFHYGRAYVTIPMEGTVVGSYFVSRLFTESRAHVDEYVGRKQTYSIGDGWDMERFLLRGLKKGIVKLDESVYVAPYLWLGTEERPCDPPLECADVYLDGRKLRKA